MRIAAYVMAGDPAWAAQSIASYYDLVDRIVVSYDIDGLSWAGFPMDVDGTIARMLEVDSASKIELLPGAWHDPDAFTLDMETRQRQAAIDHVSEGVDWVLQLDSDEIALAPARLANSIVEADRAGAGALHYPLRHVYQRTLAGKLLEQSRRWGGVRAGYPGPVAVRSGTRLTHCRQVNDVEHFRIDFEATNTDPAHPHDAPVHGVVSTDEAIMHMSWVRTQEQMEGKAKTSGHAEGRDWDKALRRWRWSAVHPRSATWRGWLGRDSYFWLRLAQDPVGDGAGDYYRE